MQRFRLTIRNVNVGKSAETALIKAGFRLTIRNVNLSYRKAPKFVILVLD